ncbi:MAG: hypothetical protein ACI4RV_00200 [Eubacteriales bacterium]
MENPSPKAENTLCERVQDALISETPLDGEQTRHLENCDACRTYREQLKRMRSDLAALQVSTLTDKDGTGVADAVMEEIRRQALFGRSPGALRKKLFRHAGLAAACFIVLVMAAPVVFHMWLPAHNAETSADSAAPLTMNALESKASDTSDSDSSLLTSDGTAALPSSPSGNAFFSGYSEEQTAESTDMPEAESAPSKDRTDSYTFEDAPTEQPSNADTSSENGLVSYAYSSDSSSLLQTYSNKVPDQSKTFNTVADSCDQSQAAYGSDAATDAHMKEDGAVSGAGGSGIGTDSAENVTADNTAEAENHALTAVGGTANASNAPDADRVSGSAGNRVSLPFSQPEDDAATAPTESVGAADTDSFDALSPDVPDASVDGTDERIALAFTEAFNVFGYRYTFSEQDAVLTELTETRVRVEFATDTPSVKIQVFLTLQQDTANAQSPSDNSMPVWTVAVDDNGQAQVFAVTMVAAK